MSVGAAAAVAVQASASGSGTPSPAAPPKPGAATTPPPVRPLTSSGQLSPAASATNAHCGQTITASLTLNGDMYCSGSALTVTGPNVVLNLGGHEIAGPGNSNNFTGVTLWGKSDTVTNGLITNFYYGVQVYGATDTVSALRVTYTGLGINDSGQATKITNSTVANSSFVGIYGASTGGVYSGDHEISNNNGMFVQGQNMTITGNIANGNLVNGILDGGFGNKFTNNTADFNGYDGIYVTEVAAVDGGGNSAKGNDITTGVPPVQCRGIVCE